MKGAKTTIASPSAVRQRDAWREEEVGGQVNARAEDVPRADRAAWTCLGGDDSSPGAALERPGLSRDLRLCRDWPVLVDEPAEHVVPIERERGRPLRGSPTAWQPEAEASMWTAGVVVGEVLTEDRFEVATTEHEHPVEALRAYGADKAFRVRVGPRRPDRGLDDLGTVRLEVSGSKTSIDPLTSPYAEGRACLRSASRPMM